MGFRLVPTLVTMNGVIALILRYFTEFDNLSHLRVSFLLFFLFCFRQCAPRSHFLTDRHDLYAKTHVSGQGCAFWVLDNIRLHLGVKPPKNSPKWVGIHFAAKSSSSKRAIYWSLMKILVSNFPDRLNTGSIIEEMQN